MFHSINYWQWFQVFFLSNKKPTKEKAWTTKNCWRSIFYRLKLYVHNQTKFFDFRFCHCNFIKKYRQSNYFTPDDSIRDFLGLTPKVIYREYILSDFSDDNLSFENIFLEPDKAQGLLFKGKRSSIIHRWTMTINPGYEYAKILQEVLVGIGRILKISFQP